MSDVTRILSKIEGGDPSAAEQLLLIYDELRALAAAKMADESPDHTLQATALVHEAERKRGQDSFFGKRETRQTLYFLSEAGGDLRRTA